MVCHLLLIYCNDTWWWFTMIDGWLCGLSRVSRCMCGSTMMIGELMSTSPSWDPWVKGSELDPTYENMILNSLGNSVVTETSQWLLWGRIDWAKQRGYNWWRLMTVQNQQGSWYTKNLMCEPWLIQGWGLGTNGAVACPYHQLGSLGEHPTWWTLGHSHMDAFWGSDVTKNLGVHENQVPYKTDKSIMWQCLQWLLCPQT